MKKFFSIGLAVLLGVSLFLTGCPTDSDDYNPAPPSGNWYDGLASPSLTGVVLLEEDLTVPAGETLTVSGVTLTVNGTLTVTAPGKLEGTDGTSQLVVHANATVNGVTGVTAGVIYLWAAHTAWLDEDDVTAAADGAVTALGEGNVETDANDPTKVKVKDGATLTGSPVIPTGVTLAVPDGKTLTVADEVELTVTVSGALEVDGTLDVAGTLEVAGKFDIPETGVVVVESGGAYVLEATATGTNEGTITVKDGGSTWGKGGNIEGDGVNVIEESGKAFLGGENAATRTYVIGGEDVEDGDAANTAPIILLDEGAKLTFNNAGYRLDGDATLNGLPGTGDVEDNNFFSLQTPKTLKIGANSTLNVPNNEDGIMVFFVVVEEDGPPLLLGESGAQIVLASKAYIMFTEGDGSIIETDISSKSWNNFYSATSTKETGENGFLFNKTYKWDANAGGNGVPGWLLEEEE